MSATEGCLAVIYVHSTSQMAAVLVSATTALRKEDIQYVHTVPDGDYTIAVFGNTLSCREHKQYPSVLEQRTIVASLESHGDEGDNAE